MPILLTALLACKQYDSIEEACNDRVPGEGSLESSSQTAFALGFATRQNCYRRFAGLSQAPVEGGAQYAVEQHAEYLSASSLYELGGAWGTEVPGEAYYGPDVFSRLESAGFDYSYGDYGLWEILWTLDDVDATGGDIVDAMMLAPEWHEIVLQFEPRAVAMAQGEDDSGLSFVYGNLIYDFPASEFKSWVTYPRDGQVGVPTESLWGNGTALSVVIGSTSASGSYDGENPYEIEMVRTPALVGPEGEVAVTWTLPGADPALATRYSLVGEPTAQLAPNAAYTLAGEVRWDGGEKSFDIAFTTGDEGDGGAARRADRVGDDALRLRHHAAPR